MKKTATLLMLGLLAYTGYGQEKTGINTTSPKATLDVVGNPTDANSLDGIISPRLTGDQLQAKTYTADQKGTMVYVTAAASTANQTGQTINVKEEGQYVFNGTVWTKFTDTNDAEWVYEGDSIRLKRSGTSPFANKIYYGEKGARFNLAFDSKTFFNSTEPFLTFVDSVDVKKQSYNVSAVNSSSIRHETNSNNWVYDKANASYLKIDEGTVADYILNQYMETWVPKTSTKNYTSLAAQHGLLINQGQGYIGSLYGNAGAIMLAKGSGSVGQIRGVEASTYVATNERIGVVMGLNSFNKVDNDGSITGQIDELIGVNQSNLITGNANIGKSIGYTYFLDLANNRTLNTNDIYGFLYKTPRKGTGSVMNIQNEYGILLGDVNHATNNYAIYTNAGINSFGDDVRIRNINNQVSSDSNHKVVVADANGTLRVTNASLNPNPASNSWLLTGNAGTNPATNFIGTTDNQPLNIRTNNTNKVTIMPNGNVGIGITNPTQKLHVSGGNILNESGSWSGLLSISYTNGPEFPTFLGMKGGGSKISPVYPLKNSILSSFIGRDAIDGKNPNVGLNFGGSGMDIIATENITKTNKGSAIRFWTTANGTARSVEKMRIAHNGNIGIGTSIPTQKLHVIGNILASGTITPDYVFEKYYNGESTLKADYEMMNLSEVEAFTKEHKHLPGVPSAKEVEEKGGVLVNRATEINLEKIEELYLHTIEQEKKIEAQNKENKELRNKVENLEKLVKQLLNK